MCFSLGVILYIMISGQPPFIGDEYNYKKLIERLTNNQRNKHEEGEYMHVDVERSILKSDVKFSYSFDGISDTCKDLILKMLKKSPQKRIELKNILNHPWFNCSHQHNMLTVDSSYVNKTECKEYYQ
mmetsp:Transcript_80839/g.174737  ORF Transcript_80839/g.174737 Transcript_80839/m.174737 type:complete len:127 (-) Transcript_80839:298-678(-)